MISSFKKFHQDIPLIYYGQRDIDIAKQNGYSMGQLAPYFGSILSKHYRTVVSIESDNIVCARTDEIIQGDYDVAVAMNNYKGQLGYKLHDVSADDYINTGIIASTRKDFWDLWKKNNIKHSKNYNFVEQDVVNMTLAYNDFYIKYLDKKDLFYCSSIRKVWDKLELKNQELWCDGRLVKVIHWAGGGKHKFDWKERGFSKEVCDYFDYLTKKGTDENIK